MKPKVTLFKISKKKNTYFIIAYLVKVFIQNLHTKMTLDTGNLVQPSIKHIT